MVTEKNSKISDKGSDEDDNDGDESGLFDLIRKTSYQQKKIDKSKLDKATQEAINNQIRYNRELNTSIKNETNKKIESDFDPSTRTIKIDENETGSYLDQRQIDLELNSLNAKLIKAEMMNDRENMKKIQEQIEIMKKIHHNSSIKYVHKSIPSYSKSSNDCYGEKSVKELYLESKALTSKGEAWRFATSTSKIRDADDEYEGNCQNSKKARLERDQSVFLKERSEDEKCLWCLELRAKHLLLKLPTEISENCYISLTPYRPCLPNICLLITKHHFIRSSLDADLDTWVQIRQFMRKMSAFFDRAYDCTVLFMETFFMSKKRNQSRHHFVIECVPIENQFADSAKIYFYKAINESGKEWAINKKLIKLDKNPVTKKLPKGLPYFWVSIGPEFNGYAHIIEDEDHFDANFGLDIICSLYEIDSNVERSRKKENYDQQLERIKNFKQKWNNFI
ncbi:2-oxoisovalerate dehydrogenase subunit alpha [Sarcoptes scabiei]|nr:2-oxoisovalerate dehydrogenase subunit alpha [Sarcoptes scabiei]